MSSSGQPPRKGPSRGRANRAKRQSRSSPDQLSRAQIQAMEARSRATVIPTEEVVVVEEADSRPTRRRAGGTAARAQRAAPRPRLTKAQEYAYIRSDLRRLVVIAAPLLVAMIALLFVLEM